MDRLRSPAICVAGYLLIASSIVVTLGMVSLGILLQRMNFGLTAIGTAIVILAGIALIYAVLGIRVLRHSRVARLLALPWTFTMASLSAAIIGVQLIVPGYVAPRHPLSYIAPTVFCFANTLSLIVLSLRRVAKVFWVSDNPVEQ
jgi:hypothetical protein